jgi:hypothetical protein
MTNEDRIATLEGQVLAPQHFVRALLSQQPPTPQTHDLRAAAARACRSEAGAIGETAAQGAERVADVLFKAPTRPA